MQRERERHTHTHAHTRETCGCYFDPAYVDVLVNVHVKLCVGGSKN